MDLENVVARVREEAPMFYAPLPYHGWSHIEETERYALALIERCKKYNVQINKAALLLAVYLHDAFYSVPPGFFRVDTGQKVTSREMFAAEFARRYLLEYLGVPAELAEGVYSIIMATHFSVIPDTPEAMLMRAADLANLAGPYDIFGQNWYSLYRENCLINGQALTEEEFALKTAGFLPLYLWAKLQLTPEYYNDRGASAFHTGAVGNIVRKVREVCGEVIRVVAEVGPGLMPIVFNERFQDERVIYIGIDSDTKVLPRALKHIGAKRATGCQIGPTYLIPGEAAHLPLLNKMVDCLVYRNALVLIEMFEVGRVLRREPPGEVRVIETYSPDGPPCSPGRSKDRIRKLKEQFEALGMKVLVEGEPSGEFELRAQLPS